MQKVQLSNDDTSDFTDDPGYMFGFSVTVNPFNGDVCFGQSMGDALYIYDSAGGDYLDMVNTGTANVIQSPNQKIPDRKTKCVIKTHINIKQNVIFGAKLKPV